MTITHRDMIQETVYYKGIAIFINNKTENMNRTSNYFKIFIMALLTIMTMAGCTDDDTQQAYDLNGYWQGSIQGDYYSNRYGGNDSWDTEIWFVQEGDFSNGGYGREIDYARRSGYVYDVKFDWEVRNGRIYIDYYDGYHIIIRDYELYYIGSGQRFRGYFEDWDTGRTLASFDLVKVGGWSNWAKQHKMEFSKKPMAPADSTVQK